MHRQGSRGVHAQLFRQQHSAPFEYPHGLGPVTDLCERFAQL
ncbi:MAG: hypothetical protein WCC30_12955 [Candidatus Dormiibacterota bacterium]